MISRVVYHAFWLELELVHRIYHSPFYRPWVVKYYVNVIWFFFLWYSGFAWKFWFFYLYAGPLVIVLCFNTRCCIQRATVTTWPLASLLTTAKFSYAAKIRTQCEKDNLKSCGWCVDRARNCHWYGRQCEYNF